MKKILLPLILLLIIFSGCKKEKEDYYVSFNVNGVQKKYTGYVVGSIEEFGSDKELFIVGAASALTVDDYFGIYINNYPGSGNFTTGEYTDASTNFTVLSTYENGGFAYEAGHTLAEEAATHGVNITHFKVTITHMDSKTIRGTFSGDFYDEANVQTGTKISVTNGEFAVKVID